MLAEERDPHRYEEVVPEEHSLDELAKALASGTISRGRALKALGASLWSPNHPSTPFISSAPMPCF